MMPVLLTQTLANIGTITIRAFPFFLCLSFFAALTLALKEAPHYGFRPILILRLWIAVCALGVLGSFLLNLFIFQNLWAQCQSDWSSCLSLIKNGQTGMTFYGGLLLAMAYSYFFARYYKMSWPAVLDFSSIPIVLACAIGRIGCFLNGCCYGAPTQLPWGIASPGHAGVLLHPTQLYNFILYMFIAWFAYIYLRPRRQYEGQLAAQVALLASIARFITEIARGDNRGIVLGGWISPSQAISVGFAVVAALFLLKHIKKRLSAT
jgi:phosphatidylglycerol:prolipoprotein diacylglycerol transferase